MDWDKFVQLARALAPGHKLDVNRYLIGILDHRECIHDKLKQRDFCWMGRDEKTTGQIVCDLYQKRYGIQCVQLYSRDRLVSDDDFIKSFSNSEDGFTVFMAVDPMGTEARPPSSASLFRESPDAEVSQTSGQDNDATTSTETGNCSDTTVLNAKQVHVKEEGPPSPILTSLTSDNQTVRTAPTLDPSSILKLSPSKGADEDLVPLDQQIRRVIDLQDPDILEAGVARSMQVLEDFKQIFSHHIKLKTDAELAAWSEAIERLLPQAERKRAIIGVVGNTGAGKSSVINALLDEERLVPTNCMRACTAVVTEISWNSSASASKYRADIDFISREDWQRELSVLMQEFLSGNGTVSREAQDVNSEAGVAWAKFHAVYPSVAKNEVHESIIPTLMSETSVESVLGTTQQICMDRPEDFYTALQKYVDSKEKVIKDKDKGKGKRKKPPPEMEYWPLIKVVKIYTTSSVLSTGAVIVDLPGVHDSNAARAAISQGYMKQCTSLWIVAPINRAVDDKAAKTLLGDSFKRQLKYDGGFSSITFICSKTDDISITEAIGSLELEAEVADLDEQRRNCNEQIEHALSGISELKESQKLRKAMITDTAGGIKTWQLLQEQLEQGIPVYAPFTGGSKRKKARMGEKSQKRRQGPGDDSDDDFFCTSNHSSSSEDDVQFQAERVRLCESDIREKLKELKETKENAHAEGLEAQNAIKQLKAMIRQSETENGRIKAKVSRICINGRNLYSKSAIQRDFASGIKEMDQANAAETDEDNFDPDEEMRDYDQVAQSLPVFCVSSRAYQKMCGRMQKDDNVPGFATAEETEVPQLQDHCRKLTAAGRCQTSRAFLTNFSQLLITFRLWTLGENPTLKLTDKDKERLLNFLDQKLEELRTNFDKVIQACIEYVRSEMNIGVSSKLSRFISRAIKDAPEKASTWGQVDQGGLQWASYKAVVRRDGIYYSTAAGHRDFNSDLVEPIMKPLTPNWERTFQTYLPEAITKYVGQISQLPREFHEAVEVHAQSIGIEPTTLSILSSKVPHYEQLLKNLGPNLIDRMNNIQRDVNREFAPCVAKIMHAGYQACADENGPGSFKRMKEIMASHVELVRSTMFHEAVQKVCERLEAMCETVQELMEIELGDLSDQIDTDYKGTFRVASRNQLIGPQTKEDAELKSAMQRILKSIDAQFETIANGDINSVNEARQIGVKVEEPDHEGKGKHRNINVLAEDSLEAHHENNNYDGFSLDDLSSTRCHGLTWCHQANVEDDMSDVE